MRRLRTSGLAFLVLCDAVYASGGFDGRRNAAAGLPASMSQHASGVGMMIAVIGFALMAAVAYRHRHPVALALAGSAFALVQLGPTAALIGLMSVLMARPLPDAYKVAPVVAAATVIAVWRDLMSTPAQTSFWGTFFAADGNRPTWWVPIFLAAGLLAVFVGLGAWLRTRAQLRTVTVVAEQEREVVSSLTDQVSRQAERERLAREIHDGLGHNLSILSVHAGALQAMADATAADAPTDALDADGTPNARASAQMKDSAQVVRETAARSVAELHSLLDLLRHADDPDMAAPTKTLRDVRALIDDSVTAGMPLIATVYVDDGETLDPHIAQAAYRIVQELLTNARKHAATVTVRLSLSGGPADGHLVIATANHLPAPTGPGRPAATVAPHMPDPTRDTAGNASAALNPTGGGARRGMGLTGIRERVQHHGGDMEAGIDNDTAFRVAIRLPWAPAGVDVTKGRR